MQMMSHVTALVMYVTDTQEKWSIAKRLEALNHVLVTTIASVDQSSAAEEDQEEKAEGKMTMTKLMSLLPVYFTLFFT